MGLCVCDFFLFYFMLRFYIDTAIENAEKHFIRFGSGIVITHLFGLYCYAKIAAESSVKYKHIK